MATAQKTAKKTTRKANRADDTVGQWTDEEIAAMKEHANELKKAKTGKVDGEKDLLDKIAAMPPSDRAMAERIHAIVQATAPALLPRTFYGMPAYSKDGKVVCFFQAAAKFKARYATFGFEQAANLDEGTMWPTAFALTKLTAADEKEIAALVRKAAR
jgi:uncharacterized protein YdhG (YjbR/CyaY superfamily)